MTDKKKILYIQHASSIGGSIISLRELVRNSSVDFDCVILCTNNLVSDYYARNGYNTEVVGINSFSHNSAFWYKLTFKNILMFLKMLVYSLISCFRILNYIKKFKPNIVHLNSQTLFLYLVPFHFFLPKVKLVIHIRENVVSGYFGVRKYFIKSILNKFADAIIYISEKEFNILMTHSSKSHVVYNYINDNGILPMKVKTDNCFNFVIMGGLFKLKGGDVILEAFNNSKEDIKLFVLGSDDVLSGEQKNQIIKIDGIEYYEKIKYLTESLREKTKIFFLGKVDNPLNNINQCHSLIFWANEPHFPRPVYEGWLLQKPVLYFNEGFESIDINGESVLMIDDKKSCSLQIKIESLVRNYQYYYQKFEKYRNVSLLKFSNKNYLKIYNIYHDLLN